MRLYSVIGLLLMLVVTLAMPAAAQENDGTEGLIPFTKETNYLSIEGFKRWQNIAQGTVYQQDTQYMSAAGYARWQNYLKAKNWAGPMKAAVLAKAQRDEQKKMAMEKLAIMRFLGTEETFTPEEQPEE
ncbi:MAG: hypothetical protein ACYDCO_12080 [Armatimonadota bacterium]